MSWLTSAEATAEVTKGVKAWAAGDEAMARLEAAMRALYPKGDRPSLARLAELVLFALLRAHERHTGGTLDKFSGALARTLDDLHDLRSGVKLPPARTAALQAADMRAIDEALRELVTFEARMKELLGAGTEDDISTAIRRQLEDDLGVAAKAAAPTPTVGAWKVSPKVAKVSAAFQSAVDDLHAALRGAAGSANELWRSRNLPQTVRDAAAALVAVEGDAVRVVRKLVGGSAGADRDALVIAVLWSQGHIEPGTPMRGTIPDAFQEFVTKLPFEWTGHVGAGGPLGETVGIDGLERGVLVDAKFSAVPAEKSPHLIGKLSYASGGGTRPVPANDAERMVVDQQHTLAQKMRRQLEWARANGLKGIEWVCSDEDLRKAFEAFYAEHVHGGVPGTTATFTTRKAF